MRPEGLCQRILPTTLSVIELVIFRLVVQYLNQLATAYLNYEQNSDEILSYVCVCLLVRVLFLSDFSQILILRQIFLKVLNMKLLENLLGGIRAVSC